MYATELLSVPDAARHLGVTDQRVRALIRDGVIDAQRVGGRWVLQARAVEDRLRASRAPGRPFNQSVSWALLHLIVGEAPEWLSASHQSQLKRRLRTSPRAELVAKLKSRAELRRYRAHPASIDRLAEEPELHEAGVSAAAAHGADVSSLGELEAYVSSSNWSGLERSYPLGARSEAPNLFIHVTEDGERLPANSSAVWSLVVALDLIEADDGRSQRAGQELLDRLWPS